MGEIISWCAIAECAKKHCLMDPKLLDNPLILSTLFYPRRDEPGNSRLENVYDGTIPVGGDIALGYRLFAYPDRKAVIVYFHGNGEIASDYDFLAPEFGRAGAALLVVDFRGYGWSTGTPLVSALLSDTEAVYTALPAILKHAKLPDGVIFVMGRSLGSACAIHIAHEHPERFKGVIVESGFAHAIPLLARLGLPVNMLGNIPDPIGNVQKMQSLHLPLLVIHGERDTLIPIANGQALYDASPSVLKRIARIAGAGHNDLLLNDHAKYFGAIAEFISTVAAK
jgi:alpha-beta hydrolase superfamily lysophospholipase